MSSRTSVQTVVVQPLTPPPITEIQPPIHSSNSVEAIEVVIQQPSSETISNLRYKKFADEHLPIAQSSVIEIEVELDLNTDSDIEYEDNIQMEDDTKEEPQTECIPETEEQMNDNLHEEEEVISTEVEIEIEEELEIDENSIEFEDQEFDHIFDQKIEESEIIKNKKKKKKIHLSSDTLTNKILGNHNSDSSDSERYKPQAMIEAARANELSCCESMLYFISSCFPQRYPTIEIDDRSYKIERLIAEGGFSFVYCAHSKNKNKQKFAIKKMIVQTSEQLKQAKWEMHVMKHLQMQQKNNNNNNHEQIALEYKSNNNYILPLVDSIIVPHKKIPEFKIVFMVFPYMVRGNLVSVMQDMYDQGQNWMDEQRIYGIFIRVCFSVYELHRHQPSWAHRDIKLDNILLGMNDEPYLMDFGSTSEAKVHVRCRTEALEVQEWAQTHMSGPYTPPEFFDCKSKFKFDVRTDVWALGCLLYAMAFGRSPFDQDSGSSALAVLGGNVVYPEVHPYSENFIALVDWMVKIKLKERPFVPAIIERVHDVIREMEVEK